MISFFLSVRFPRTRWQANCVFRSIATRKHNETLRLWPGSAEHSEAIGARVRTQVKIFFCFCYNLPLPSTCRLTPSPCAGKAFCLSHFFIFRFSLYFFPCKKPLAGLCFYVLFYNFQLFFFFREDKVQQNGYDEYDGYAVFCKDTSEKIGEETEYLRCLCESQTYGKRKCGDAHISL